MGAVAVAARSALASPQYGSAYPSAMSMSSAMANSAYPSAMSMSSVYPSGTAMANSAYASGTAMASSAYSPAMSMSSVHPSGTAMANSAYPSAMATSMSTSMSMNSGSSGCGSGLMACQVIDPMRKEAPWAGSTNAHPQCYDPARYTCTSNFLCPMNAPKISGQYACGPVMASQASAQMNSMGGSSPSSASSAPKPQLSITVNVPGAGDIDGIKGLHFIVDLTIDVTDTASNGLIPFKPLYQDASSSTFGVGPNAAFPGLVVLQNTTMTKGPLTGPNTNLAGVFQLNGVSKVNGLNQYNTVWDDGAPLFGIGASELVVYYVNQKAGKTMTFTPGSSEGLVSNVVQIPFTISNRSSNAVPQTTPHCTNGAMFMENNATTPAGMPQVSAQIFRPLNGDVVGVNGSGWILDLLFDATSTMANSLISQDAGYTSGFVNQSSPAFKPGRNSLIPGLVVLLNTTIAGAPLSGPGTNLAGLFQINNFRTVNCDTIIEIWAEWLVGKPIGGHGPSQINVFLVNGTAPNVIKDTSNLAGRADLISSVSTVDIILS